jgi:hypothetical protein
MGTTQNLANREGSGQDFLDSCQDRPHKDVINAGELKNHLKL